MDFCNDEYTKILRVKLDFYKNLLRRISNTRDIYDIVVIESTIDFAFPGSKLDNNLLETLMLAIETTSREISLYRDFEPSKREEIKNNNLEYLTNKAKAITDYSKKLEEKEIGIYIDRNIVNSLDTIDRSVYDDIGKYVDYRTNNIKEDLKGKRL